MNLYILDTDHVTLHQRNHPQVRAKVQSHLPNELAITIITVEEQMRGRLAQIGGQGIDSALAYEQLQASVAYFCDLIILPFDSGAKERYDQLRSQKIRIGTLDLRIASIVLSQDAVLITRNQRDFKQIPGLKLEDWSTSQ